MPAGAFIVFEGPDGAGKSTQATLLSDRLAAAGHDVLLTREPGGTPAGEQIRSILLDRSEMAVTPRTEALLHSAARAQHVAEVIEPAIERGRVVICDRFTDSTLAYQGGGHGLSLVDLVAIQSFATNGLKPDLKILIDIDAKDALVRRLEDKGTINRMDAASLDYHERVAACYHQLTSIDPARWFVVDGRGTQAEIGALVMEAVRNKFPALSDI